MKFSGEGHGFLWGSRIDRHEFPDLTVTVENATVQLVEFRQRDGSLVKHAVLMQKGRESSQDASGRQNGSGDMQLPTLFRITMPPFSAVAPDRVIPGYRQIAITECLPTKVQHSGRVALLSQKSTFRSAHSYRHSPGRS